MLKNPLYQLLALLAFTFLLLPCYLYIDQTVCLQTQQIRDQFYIPLRLLSIITSPGAQLPFWSLAFIFYLVIKKNREKSLFIYPILASMIASNTLIRFIKIFVGRSRPDMLLISNIYEFKFLSFERFYSSFPSGHAATLASFMAIFAVKYPRQALFWIGLTIGLSLCRVYISAHYLSDVLFGSYLGFYFTWIFYYNQCDNSPSYLIYTTETFSWKKLILSRT